MFRCLLALVVLALVAIPNGESYWWAFGLTIVTVWLDGVDGFVARWLKESSTFGAVLDILCDRIVEMIFWIGFLSLGWVHVAVPLVFMIRGIAVDGLRAMALEQGMTAFGSNSMMQSQWGVALVSSRASRWLYAVCKAVVFALLVLVHHPDLQGCHCMPSLYAVTHGLVWFTVAFCVIRGLPVLIESRRFFSPPSQS